VWARMRTRVHGFVRKSTPFPHFTGREQILLPVVNLLSL